MSGMSPFDRMHGALAVPGLSTVEKMVLMVLVTHADAAGRCWPAVATIAQGASCSIRGVRDAVRALELGGVVLVSRTPGAGNRYQIRFDHLPARSAARLELVRGADSDPDRRPNPTPAPDAEESGAGCPSPRQSVPPSPAPDASEGARVSPGEQDSEGNTHIQVKAVSDQARELVCAFHRDFRKRDGHAPLPKELRVAEALIREHGRDCAWSVVRYAIAQARRTHFEMATFCAVRQYVGEARAQPPPEPPGPSPRWPLDPPLTEQEAEELRLGFADDHWRIRGYTEEQIDELRGLARAATRLVADG